MAVFGGRLATHGPRSSVRPCWRSPPLPRRSATAATVLTPAKPTVVKLAAATSSSITVTSAKATYARGYRVFASTTRSDVYLANIGKARRSGISTSPRVTLGGLPYTSAPYYYRIQAINGTKVHWSDMQTGYVRPETPSAVRPTGAANTGLALSWSSRTAGRYVITQATNATMTAGVRTYAITSQAHRFTPYDLHKGTRYYFQGAPTTASSPHLRLSQRRRSPRRGDRTCGS